MAWRTLILAAMLWLAAGASALPAIPEGPAQLGQTVQIASLVVRPLTLVEDSRCPAKARCVWAGRVIVRAEVTSGAAQRVVDLTLGDSGVPVADGRLRLVAVAPDRPDELFPPSSYRFSFAFQAES